MQGFYDRARYASRAHYSADPVPPLAEEDRAWAEALLREAGLRE